MGLEIAKIIEDGEGQVVLLPKNFCFNTDEVVVQQLGDAVILVPKRREKVSDCCLML